MPNPDPTTFAHWLTASRKRAGRSQLRLAELAGISQGMISNLEGGRRRPSRAVVVAIAAALGIDPTQGLLALGFTSESSPAAAILDPDYESLRQAGWPLLPERDKQELIEWIQFKLARAAQPAFTRRPIQSIVAVDSNRTYELAAYTGNTSKHAAKTKTPKRKKDDSAKRRQQTFENADTPDEETHLSPQPFPSGKGAQRAG